MHVQHWMSAAAEVTPRPDQKVEGGAEQRALSPSGDIGSVLVVEDDELSQAFARAVLEDAGYRVLVAGNGPEGLVVFQTARPDCILLDMHLPGLDGASICRRLRALPGGTEVPIVFMTAQGGIDAFDKAFECGGDDFVTKPVSPSELLGRVQAALGLRRARSVASEYALIKAQRDRLMRQQLQKERLSALLVHDLKSPLNTISLLAQTVLRSRTLHEGDREAVAEIRAQVTRMSDMVMNLLDISKARDGKLVAHPEPIDLRSFCPSVLADFERKAKNHQVKLQTMLFESTLVADPHLLRRLLENLFENALRYAPPGSNLLLAVRPRADHTELRVADEGQGIPPELRERVFEAFTQADSGGVEGRGLGLAFCRLAVTAHRGSIWVEDGAPGAVFCVALPKAGTSHSGSYPACTAKSGP